MTGYKSLLVLLAVVLAVAGCRDRSDSVEQAARHVTALHWPGCPNAYRVSPHLVRGAQPTRKGLEQLAAQGITTVVNLRSAHSDDELLDGLDLDYVEIPMHAGSPKLDHARRFLAVVTDPNRLPVFVHCQHGANRTGAMVAAYRIVVQGWTNEAALEEMVDGPFGYHKIWRDLRTFVRELDGPALRRELNLPDLSAESPAIESP